jgi:2-polyprenyl-6-methoxyphenol hydroxylase-like FAD-dependent oxidoreductase
MIQQIDSDDGRYTLSFEKQDGFIVQHEADIVVGADGIRSTVRQRLLETTVEEGTTALSTATPLRYLDCLVVLGIFSLNLLDQNTTMESELLNGQTVFQTADGSTRIYLMPYSSTAYMWQLSFPMKDETLAKEISNNGPAALRQEALKRCGKWHAPIPEILEKTPVDLVSGYPVYDRDLITLDMLHNAATKSATLIGDAAHPMSPFKGQGANQALLDALSLARSIVRVTHNKRDKKTDIQVALDEYHAEMVKRSAVKVTASAEAAQFLHSSVAIQKGNVTRGAAAASSTQDALT